MQENEQQNPSTAEAVEVQQKNAVTDGIDFNSINALANSDFVPESRLKTFGYGLLEKLVSLGLFLLGFLLDIFKTLWVIIKGIFVGIVKAGIGVFKFIRSIVRMCKEGDIFVKLSTVVSGLGNIKGGQKVDGIIFLACEIFFILYMSLFGGKAIYNFIYIGERSRGMDGVEQFLPNNSSMTFLISGIVTFIVIIAYLFVWYNGIKSAHDNYIVRNNFRFLQAHADQVDVVENTDKYTEFFTAVDAVDENGKAYQRVTYKKPHAIYKIARETYGFPELSARYLSYVPFSHIQEKPLNPFQKFVLGFKKGFYNGYDKVRNKIKAGKWSSVFAKYLEWEFLEPKSTYGFMYVRGLVLASFNKFRHTYDKYNDYLSWTRDTHSLIKVLENPELLENAIYARDPVSVKNGIEPLTIGTAVKPKVAASRVVGAFECSYADGVTASKYYLKAVAEKGKTGIEPKERVRQICASLQGRYDDFVRVNSDELKKGVNETKALYENGAELLDIYAQGKANFIENVQKDRFVSDFDAREMLRDIRYAEKVFGGDRDEMIKYLAKRGENSARIVERYETYPFHGQPMYFRKKAKQYLDERFAVTVLTLPVLGAIITSILPLFVSIFIAFTNYDNAHTLYGNFDWDLSAWTQMFSNDSPSMMYMGQTFMYILGWTIIWAIFATFSNYILGIVLALLINKKSIKFKKVFRMFFVVSIAIPQFITLLSMSKILGNGGPIWDWLGRPKYSWLTDPNNQGLSAKICLILVNVWIGIPYTMLSTSGILMNIPEDLYESASIDGASPWTQFWKITMPYILFVTGPSLLTSFIGNINNFNVIFFLTGGGPSSTRKIGILNPSAGYTDLLITFLFKITVNSATHQYSLGSVIGILVFAICSFFSLIMYSRMGSTQNEEAFQ